ncbi:putative (-)-trans-carveol dehydrogenase [Rosellinia necatrix]|uniref:Putative (-)-trans-carveol dehydrogenase n=1 Tax=Rosellinia necatrix TaxID=77044 RepID=A0A1W2TND7_ROSNE|nr:putative (-)-trans-carveol dehydrogenase [Rosellinia necatrix]
MAQFVIKDDDLTGLKGQVVIVTGSSSGIGLATVQLLLSLGASVIGTDVQPPPPPPPPEEQQQQQQDSADGGEFSFHEVSVTDWAGLRDVFKAAVARHGRVDHVFANAGVAPHHDYVGTTELDGAGDPLEPSARVLDVNLRGAVNAAALAVHYIRRNPGGGVGSVVINSSSTAMLRFRAVDYAVAKHGALGLMRGLHASLAARGLGGAVRANAVAPSWTASAMVPDGEAARAAGVEPQPASAVARAAALLMADRARRGHLVHVARGVYTEADEALLLPAYASLMPAGARPEDESFGAMREAFESRWAEGRGS